MKRKVFSALAIVVIAMSACKKEELDTTELGSAEVKGNVWADLNLTNTVNEGAAGMQVTVEVNTSDWDQQPVAGYNYDKQVYTTTCGASGDYTLTIPATQEGYSIDVTFEDLYTTRVLSNSTENVKVTQADLTHFIYDGAVIESQDIAVVTSVNNTVNQYGTATMYGTVYANYNIANWNVAPPANQRLTTASGLGAQDIVWRYETTPYGTADVNVYTMAVDLTDGSYVITVPTEAASGTAVDIDWGMLDFLGNRTQNNFNSTVDSTVAGVWTCGGIEGPYNGVAQNDGDLTVNQNITLTFTSF